MGDYADMSWDACDPDSWIDLRRPYRRGPHPKTCNRCGATGLFWEQTDNGWRLHSFGKDLHDESVMHVCSLPHPEEARLKSEGKTDG